MSDIDHLVIATKNSGKITEFESMLYGLVNKITSINDYPDIPDIEETGSSFRENALIKARIVGTYTKKPTIADDSGLEVLALNNEPGIYSARYAGTNSTDEQNIQKLLKNLENIDNRVARFICVIALVMPNEEERIFVGECKGLITYEPRGNNGFGYDPVFMIPSLNKTFAELELTEKNLYSHRSEAIGKLKAYLSNPE